MRTEKIYVGGKHDYNLVISKSCEGVTYALKRSDNSAWASPHEVVLTIEDDGNGLVIERYRKGELDYSEAHELHIVLSYIHKSQPNADTIEVRNIYTL